MTGGEHISARLVSFNPTCFFEARVHLAGSPGAAGSSLPSILHDSISPGAMLRTVEPHRGFDYPTPDVPISVATRTVDSLGRHVPPLRLEPWSFRQPSMDRRSRPCRDRCRASGG